MASSVFWADVFEPDEIIDPLMKVLPVTVGPINSQGFADYMWLDLKGNRRQVERKQIGEALSDLDSVEEQLNRELKTCDELTLLIEGPYLPTPDGVQTLVYRLMKNGQVSFLPGHRFTKQPYLMAKYEGFKRGLRAAGVVVIEVPHTSVTVYTLTALYKGSMSSESTTLKRYVQPHIPPFGNNIHVENLMRIKGGNLGPVRAQKAIEQYGTFYKVVTADIRRMSTLWGSAVAKDFFKLIRGE